MDEFEDRDEAVEDDDVTRPLGRAASDPSDSVPAPTRAGPATLRRVAPPENEGELVSLCADEYLLGRSHSCSIPLFSATASRVSKGSSSNRSSSTSSHPTRRIQEDELGRILFILVNRLLAQTCMISASRCLPSSLSVSM